MDSRKFLSPEERAALEANLERSIADHARDTAMILTALHTGARASELLALDWRDINEATGTVWLRSVKGGNDRECVVPKLVRTALARLKAVSPAKPFPISYPRLVEIWNLYKPANKPFHSLRHTFAIRAYERTRDIRFVKYALGHKSITSTMVYADRVYNASEFRKLMRVR